MLYIKIYVHLKKTLSLKEHSVGGLQSFTTEDFFFSGSKNLDLLTFLSSYVN